MPSQVATDLGAAAADGISNGGAANDGGASPLTPREVEVLRLVAIGRSDREIATELFISERTVHRHISNVRSKLDAPSRAAAAASATRNGLI